MRFRRALFIAFVLAEFLFKFYNKGSNQKLKAWSFQLQKNYKCMLNIERPIAHQSSITFFLYTLYIKSTFGQSKLHQPIQEQELLYKNVQLDSILHHQ